jgi:predicted transcriptional regulator
MSDIAAATTAASAAATASAASAASSKFVEFFWITYVMVSFFLIVEVFDSLKRNRVSIENEEQDRRYRVADVYFRIDEFEKRLNNVAKTTDSKFQQLFNLYNACMSRIEHMNQQVKTRATTERLAEESTKRKSLEYRIYRELRNVYQNVAIVDDDDSSYEVLATEHLREMNCRFYNRDTDADLAVSDSE